MLICDCSTQRLLRGGSPQVCQGSHVRVVRSYLRKNLEKYLLKEPRVRLQLGLPSALFLFQFYFFVSKEVVPELRIFLSQRLMGEEVPYLPRIGT